tara:strand:- start:974 stop:1426 length:453 start_codon:yes stop_codon:yes gene_type:complete
MTSKTRGAGLNIQTYVDPCTVASLAKLLASRGTGFNCSYSGLLKCLMETVLAEARLEQFDEFLDPESALEYLATSGFSMDQVTGWNEKRVLNSMNRASTDVARQEAIADKETMTGPDWIRAGKILMSQLSGEATDEEIQWYLEYQRRNNL